MNDEAVNVDSAYMLFYQRQELASDDFMPNTDNMEKFDTHSMDDDFNKEYKQYCTLQ